MSWCDIVQWLLCVTVLSVCRCQAVVCCTYSPDEVNGVYESVAKYIVL